MIAFLITYPATLAFTYLIFYPAPVLALSMYCTQLIHKETYSTGTSIAAFIGIFVVLLFLGTLLPFLVSILCILACAFLGGLVYLYITFGIFAVLGTLYVLFGGAAPGLS